MSVGHDEPEVSIYIRGGTVQVTQNTASSVPPAESIASPDEPLLIDAVAVAKLLGLHRNTVYQMARRGELVARKVGGRLMFEPSEVRDWIKRLPVAHANEEDI